MKKLLSCFLKGVLILVPLAITVSVFAWAFTALDTLFRRLFNITFPGLGILATIVLVFIIGFLASNIIGRKLLAYVDMVFTKLPLVKLLYGSVKDLTEAFAGEKKRFDKPVLVTPIKGEGAKLVGFVTRQNLEKLGLDDYVAVYLPQAYNYAGNLMLFPKDAVVPLNIDSAKAIAFVISAGVSGIDS